MLHAQKLYMVVVSIMYLIFVSQHHMEKVSERWLKKREEKKKKKKKEFNNTYLMECLLMESLTTAVTGWL